MVVGIGGGGNKAIQRMMNSKIHGVSFVAVNLDAQDLNLANTPAKIHWQNLTRGLGAGMIRKLADRQPVKTKTKYKTL